MKFELSSRLKSLPPYLFVEIDRKKAGLKNKGTEVFDLSIGDPDIPAPALVCAELCKQSKIKENQKYALDKGSVRLRQAVKDWFKARFGVSLDKEKEILPLIGSKEGLVHFPLAFVNPGDYVIIPSPGYPGYRGAGIFAAAKIYELPLLEGTGFLPQLNKIPLSVRNKAKVIFLNYPNNPTTALAPRSFLEELAKFCSKYGIIIAYDNAYSEMYSGKKPLSILQIKGAKETALEFHSFSKTFCMTGFRLGWACGNKNLIAGLLKVKANIDSGVFTALQYAGALALEKESGYTERVRRIIEKRRKSLINILRKAGFGRIYSEATFYVWAKIPEKYKSSAECVKALLDKGIVSTPGLGFGRYGEGFVRFALTIPKEKIEKMKRVFLQ